MADDTSTTDEPTTDEQTTDDGNKKAVEDKVDQQYSGYSTKNGPHPMGVDGSNLIMDVGNDILNKNYQKYDNVQELEGIQLQYQSGNGNIKVVNFKQDYVVLIRKKVCYAANATSMQMGTTAGQIGDGNYLRTYKIDNFTSVKIDNSVIGNRPGSCSVDIQGAERVMCFEQSELQPGGTPNVTDLATKNAPSGIGEVVRDSNNSFGLSGVLKKSQNGTLTVNDISSAEQSAKPGEFWNRTTKSDDGSSVTTRVNDDGLTGDITVQQSSGDKYTVTVPITTSQNTTGEMQDDYRSKSIIGLGNDNNGQWKFAEKCDWEPMDEVWVFGKSNFERDVSKDFKMNQIFFGYIDTVQKTHTSGKSNGCTIKISATDQLKMLDLSYVTQNPSMMMGVSTGGGLDLRYGKQDPKHSGTFQIFLPYEVANHVASQGGSAEKATEAQQTAMQQAYKYLVATNIFASVEVEKIIKQLCLDAGVPPWYVGDRIEPIKFPPFTYNIKQASSGQLFQASMKKRLNVCNEAAEKLMLEFFADEQGNIVLKCPNYALGVNSLVKNNMGFSQLNGGLLDQIDTTEINDAFWSRNDYNLSEQQQAMVNDAKAASGTETGKDADLTSKGYVKVAGTDANTTVTNGYVKGKDGIYMQAPTQENNKKLSDSYKTYLNAKASSVIIQHNGRGNLAGVAEAEETSKNVNALYNSDGTTFKRVPVQPGDSLCQIAQDELGSEARWEEIYNSNIAKFRKGIGDGSYYNPEELEEAINNNGVTYLDVYNTDYGDDLNVMKAKADSEGHYVTEGTGADKNNITGNSASKFKSVARQYYSNTLSEFTDALIPEIPQEFILGFTLTDSDKNLFNMYEVNIEGDGAIYDAGGPMTQIRRTFPDLESIVRFGCRPAPKVINLPNMGNKNNAHMFGYMMCAKSVAERHSATMTMIEDSFIHVGNPVRFFAYDEHPDKPLSPQNLSYSSTSALNTMALNGNTQDLNNITQGNLDVIHQSLQDTGFYANNHNSDTYTQKQKFISTKNEGTGSETKGVTSTPQSGDVIQKGDALNQSTGPKVKMHYNGLPASQAAQTTNAQSIYYIESISRSINIAHESTMTLSLTCGRMMGAPSCVDYMLLLYKTYYDPNNGFCATLAEIEKEKKKYENQVDTYTIQADDTLLSLGAKIFNIDLQPAQKIDNGDDAEASDPYSTLNLSSSTSFDGQTYANKWKKRTTEINGKIYRTFNNSNSVIHSFTYYIYDGDPTKFVYIEDGNETNAEISDVSQSYSDHAKNVIRKLQAKDDSKEASYTNSANATNLGDATPTGANETEISNSQKLLNELKRAVISLNPDKFGNDIDMIRDQFDVQLHVHVTENILVPKVLDISETPDETTNATTEATDSTSSATADDRDTAKNDNNNETVSETGTGEVGDLSDGSSDSTSETTTDSTSSDSSTSEAESVASEAAQDSSSSSSSVSLDSVDTTGLSSSDATEYQSLYNKKASGTTLTSSEKERLSYLAKEKNNYDVSKLK